MSTHFSPAIEFQLPPQLACPLPTEERNMARDEVRLLVTEANGRTAHARFQELVSFLRQGDVLVVNTSATIAAALPLTLPGGIQGRLHLSTKVDNNRWIAEIREVRDGKTIRWRGGETGMLFYLPSNVSVVLARPFYKDAAFLNLWIVEFDLAQPIQPYLSAFARPIQYENPDSVYPLSYYQTYFSFKPGSSEMPSAGRGFTEVLIKKLLKKGVLLAPVLLHTGVSSLEENETPYPEYMEIDPVSAAIINQAKAERRRIIAVGTTCVRAVETAVNDKGWINPYQGNSALFITPDHKMKIVNGLITGFHEPRASHLNMLQSLAGYDHINAAYQQAIGSGYYWHQFGDLHLILP